MLPTSSLDKLRLVSFIEGVSFVLLIFIGMPLKYQMDMPMPNKVLGMSHGILTIVFVVALFNAWADKEIDVKVALQTFVASLIPFGAFFMEQKLKKLSQN